MRILFYPYIRFCCPISFRFRYHGEAEEKHLLVMHACAFDSVPADLGVQFSMQKFAEAHSDDGFTLSSIESFLSVDTGPSGLGGEMK